MMETKPDRVSLKPVLWLCGLLLLAHLAVDALLATRPALIPSGILLLLENLAGGVACVWRARRSSGSGRLLWSLAAAAEAIHFASGFEVGLEMVFFHIPHNVTSPADFLIFLWGVPLLLALGGPTESRPTRTFFWLDGVQITLMMVLSFVVVFGALPFQHARGSHLSGLAAVWAYTIENAAIAAVALLRVWSRAPIREQRAFLTCVAICTSLYAVLGPVYNFLNVLSTEPWIKLQFLLSLHQLGLVLLATQPVTWPGTPGRAPRYRTLALVLDNGSPIVYPSCVVVGAVVILPQHLHLGTAVILLSLLCYGARSTLLQVQLQTVQSRMTAAQRQLEQMTLTDPLTGISNRRAFNRRFEETWRRFERTGEVFCLFVIDVDHFKMLNDTQGHAAGDRSLCAIAETLSAVLRDPDDMLARIGGEEFAAIVLCDSPDAALSLARDMMEAVRSLHLPNTTPIGNTVTISIGLADSRSAAVQEEMMRSADEALYQAKRAGRSRAVAAGLQDRDRTARDTTQRSQER